MIVNKTNLKYFVLATIGSVLIFLSLIYYSGTRVESGLKSLVAHSSCTGFFTVRNLVHDRGLFSSWGVVDLDLKPSCHSSPSEASESLTAFRIDYKLSHIPGLFSFNRFEWLAKALPASRDGLANALAGQDGVKGSGTIAYSGRIGSTFELSDLDYSDADSRLQLKGSHGHFSATDGAVEFLVTAQKMVWVEPNQTVDVKQLSLSADITDWRAANGATKLEVGQLSSKDVSVEGLSLESDADDVGNVVNSSTKLGIKELLAQSVKLKNIELDTSLKGLNKKSIQDLSEAFEGLSNGEGLNQISGSKVCHAARELLLSGMTFKVEKLTGAKEAGSVEGRLSLEIKPAKPESQYALSRYLGSSGNLILRNVLTKEEEDQALATHYFSSIEGGIQSTYGFEDGVLKVNSLVLDNPEIRAFVAETDQSLTRAFLYCETTEIQGSQVKVGQEAPMVADNATNSSGTSAQQDANNTLPSQSTVVQTDDPSISVESNTAAKEPAAPLNSVSEESIELAKYRAKDSLDAANDRINALWKATDKEVRHQVLQEQRNWLKFRESECSSVARRDSTAIAMIQETKKLVCMAEMTDRRTKELAKKFGGNGATE